MFWIREIAGWLLVLLGLMFFFVAYVFCQEQGAGQVNPIFEAFIMAIVGIFVFRGGIHLLKVSVAARLCALIRDFLATVSSTASMPV